MDLYILQHNNKYNFNEVFKMKKYKIGKLEYNQIEGGNDINDYRCMIFKNYLLQSFQNINDNIWNTTWERVKVLFNKGLNADAIIELNNFHTSMTLKEVKYDCFSMCFALLNLKEGENQLDCNEQEQLNKIAEMQKEGLERGAVVETVINFMKALPETFGQCLAAMEGMKIFLMENE